PAPGSPFGNVPSGDGFAATGPIQVDTTFGTSTTYTIDEVVPNGFAFVSLRCTESLGVDNSTPAEGVTQTGSHLATLKVAPGAILSGGYVNQPTGQGCSPGYWRNHASRWDGSSNATIGTSGAVNCGGSNANDFTVDVKTCRSFNAVFGVTPAQSGLANSV